MRSLRPHRTAAAYRATLTRAGAAEKAALERLGLRVVDASGYGWGIVNHDLFPSNDVVRNVIRRAADKARMAG